MGYNTGQFVGNVSENLTCGICHEVLKDPCQCPSKGHTFCRQCITEWINTHNSCPLDKNALEVEKLVPNLAVRNIIDELQVYCDPPEKDGQAAARAGREGRTDQKCDWTGKLETLDKHRETCPYQQVPCPNANCNANMQIRELEEHDKVCRYIKVECMECRLSLVRHEVVNHMTQDCPEVLIPCRNKCTNPQGQINQIKRSEMNAHIMNSCAKTIVECPFKEQGCTAQVERQDVDTHVQENMAAHMMLLAKRCSSLGQENSSLGQDNSSLGQENSSLGQENSSLGQENSSLGEQFSSLAEQFSSLAEENKQLKNELAKVKEAVTKSRGSYVWKVDRLNVSHWKSPEFMECGHKWELNLADAFPSVPVSLPAFVKCDLVYLGDMNGSKTQDVEIPAFVRLSVLSSSPMNPDHTFSQCHVFTKLNKILEFRNFMELRVAYLPAYSGDGSLKIHCSIQQYDSDGTDGI